jgi:hypothetical protein
MGTKRERDESIDTERLWHCTRCADPRGGTPDMISPRTRCFVLTWDQDKWDIINARVKDESMQAGKACHVAMRWAMGWIV